MQQNFAQQKNMIFGVVAVIVLLVIGYFGYSLTKSAEEASQAVVDPNLFSPDVRDFYNVKDKISFKDLSFMKKSFYTQLQDYTVEIPSVKPTGRPNPFVPYVTP